MNTFTRHTSRRRNAALDRLTSLTAGVAVVGVAATAGFGFAAASGYRGTGSQVSVAAAGPDGATAPQATPQPFGNGSSADGGAFAPFNNNGFQAPSRSRGSGHVSSGGS